MKEVGKRDRVKGIREREKTQINKNDGNKNKVNTKYNNNNIG